MLFIFDGLDECRLSLDFQSTVRLCNISESASVDVLLMNLIVGNLLPSALIWITSRPAAADLVPSECVHRVTEDHLTPEVIKEPLHHVPHPSLLLDLSRCSTLTQMYTHFLILQTNIKHQKDYEKKVTDEDMILKLGKVAFQQLVKGNLIFYEEDLRECGIDVTEASVYSGLCTQIFREEFGLYVGKVYCFIHLSIQEHLAALYVHLSFTKLNINVFDQITETTQGANKKVVSLSDLHQRAVDEALESQNGHLDLLLRFLLGLSLECNQALLQSLLAHTGRSPYSEQEIVKYIRKKISDNSSPEKSINLFHCLNELGDHSLVQKIQQYLKSGKIREARLSSSQWSALVFVLLTSEQKMDVFNLINFIGPHNATDEVLLKLLPVIKESRSAEFRYCGVTDEGCAAIASALRSNPSHLRELCVSKNKLGNSGVKKLCAGLGNPHCKLDKL
ncbi:protein NLRC3-like, partial [Sinocyclocheilus rhinocerous]|uniref:protein NLRC3-like n=1 Tax=Sinocyclocheilus rhinocerous TaxID=307959 RepID=UPI0007B993A1